MTANANLPVNRLSQRKRGLMNRIRGGRAALGVVALLLATAGVAHAQETTGRVTGRVSDKDTNMALGGVTVVIQGPQGEDATLTDDTGQYQFSTLPVGTYTIRFYVANSLTQVEQTGVIVSADKMVRVNAKIAGAVQTAVQETYVIQGKSPTIDVGSARVGTEFDDKFTSNVPLNRTYGDIIEHAPGAFVDPSGNVSIGGSTGLENIYIVNGMNVTGIELGNLEAGTPSTGGGTNLPLEFLTQIDVNSGGYQAEYGGGMGGVINSVLKSGSNEFHGSVFSYWSPYWFAGDPNAITTVGGSLGYVRKPDYDTNIGVEVGGPIIKDRLFFWAGFAPRFQNSHVFRQTYLQLYDQSTQGAALDANGNPISIENTYWRARIPESRQTYFYGATLDFIPRPEHRLTFALFGSPNTNEQMRSFNRQEFISNPAWAQEKLNKTNTDVTAHWTSKLMDHRWQIDAIAGMHSEYFNNESSNPALNNVNQLEYWGANLWDLEHAPGCQPLQRADGSLFQPCPVEGYRTGGFGLVKKYTGFRWSAELKSTHRFEAAGHHELKYGWHLDFTTLDQDRYYSGPLGSRALIRSFPGNFDTWNFFTLNPGEYPSSFGGVGQGAPQPYSNLLYPFDPATGTGGYRDNLKAYVKSLSNAFFLQDSFSPSFARNLTVNVGARLELQKMYDYRGVSFLDAKNIGPRIGVIYDPKGDGRSKVAFSYGRYYEAIPLNIAARYFGGEGILIRQSVPYASCANTDRYGWTGNGDWQGCNIPPRNATDPTTDQAGNGFFLANNGTNYPVQADLQGQYHNEVTATVAREVIEDLTVRLDYQHRWLGNIIEDGSTDSGGYTFVLANPGNVPTSAIDAAKAEREQANAAAAAAQTALDMAAQTDPNLPTLQANATNTAATAANADAKVNTLQDLANAPKPKRTYDAITMSVTKRFSKNWLARASYTYSRLVGNYEGLYQAELNYFAPNGNNAYDVPDVTYNQNGPLPNDRPHIGKVDGYYMTPLGNGMLIAGLSFSGRSGMPRNYVSGVLGNQIVMLLPRGAGGRTPTVTQFDGRIGYRRPLGPKMMLEGFIDFFNIFNQQASLIVDDNYTYDAASSIINGTPSDLKYAKNQQGQPITKNANYGQPLLFQAPFNGRFGLRLTF
jgi:carboxypeptidase family protein